MSIQPKFKSLNQKHQTRYACHPNVDDKAKKKSESKTTFPNCNYSRIPTYIIESGAIPPKQKSLLILTLMIMDISGGVDILALHRWWKNDHQIKRSVKLPEQLRLTLESLEDNGYIQRLYDANNKNSLIGIRFFTYAIPQTKEPTAAQKTILNSGYFYLSKTFTKGQQINLNELMSLACYASQASQGKPFVYALSIAAKLGIDEKTLRKYTKTLIDRGYLCVRTEKKGHFNIKIYGFNPKYKITRNSYKTLGESLCAQSKKHRHDFSRPIYIDFIYKNNLNLKGGLSFQEIFKNQTIIVEKLSDALQKGGGYTNTDLDKGVIRLLEIMNKPNAKLIFFSLDAVIAYLKKAIPRLSGKVAANTSKIRLSALFRSDEFLKNVVANTLTTSSILEDEAFLQKCLTLTEERLEKKYGLAYLKWKIKRMKVTEFPTQNAAEGYILKMLENDVRNPYTTRDWDEDYNPEEVSLSEKRIIREVPSLEANGIPQPKKVGFIYNEAFSALWKAATDKKEIDIREEDRRWINP